MGEPTPFFRLGQVILPRGLGVYHRIWWGTAEEDLGSMGLRWGVALEVCGLGRLMFPIQAVSTGPLLFDLGEVVRLLFRILFA